LQSSHAADSDAAFYRSLILPAEMMRNRTSPYNFDGSFRWFLSPNIVDMWQYCSPAEHQRILAHMRRRHQWAADR